MSKTYGKDSEPSYRIGAVSRLTGVAPDTLRVWERRYGAVIPFRSEAGTRLYSQEDVGRLTLIKRLVDRGDAISRVANLNKEQLHDRLEGAGAPEVGSEPARPCHVAVMGSSLPDRLAGEASESGAFSIVGLYRGVEEFLSGAQNSKADVVVLEFPTIQPEHIREIGSLLMRSGAARALIIYGFAARATLERLETPRIIPIRGPIEYAAIRRWCLTLHARSQISTVAPAAGQIDLYGASPPRRFDDSTLTGIAESSSTVRCECPRHLVDLVTSLCAFETYSEECEVLNVDDAALHAFLRSASAQARSLLETALERVVEADGIEV